MIGVGVGPGAVAVGGGTLVGGSVDTTGVGCVGSTIVSVAMAHAAMRRKIMPIPNNNRVLLTLLMVLPPVARKASLEGHTEVDHVEVCRKPI
jgi:hypothetical protein